MIGILFYDTHIIVTVMVHDGGTIEMASNRQVPLTPQLPCMIFGYGSLMSEKSLQETVGQDVKHLGKGFLTAWRRIFNKNGLTHKYVNIHETNMGIDVVHGVIFKIDVEAQFLLLARNEPGYDLVDVSDSYVPLSGPHSAQELRIYAFVHDPASTNQIRQSFLDKCTDGMSEHERLQFMEETIFPQGYRIHNDVKPAKPAFATAPTSN